MKTLVIMAAGMGSRFGGLKQIEPVGPHGEIIADYSVYDASKAGFQKVIFIIRRENEEYFRNNIVNKYKGIEVEFAYQELDNIPSDVKLPEARVKMLGTGHALMCAKDIINDDFIIINSDDFYGFNSFLIAYEFLTKDNNDYMSVNYPYSVTKSEFGKVKRGVVLEDNGVIKNIIESEIGFEDGKFIARPLDGSSTFEVGVDTPVAVNFFALRKNFLDILSLEFDKFIHGEITLTSEFLLPDVLKKCISDGKINIKSQVSKSRWMGMTYKEDLVTVKNHINNLINEGEYPEELWKM